MYSVQKLSEGLRDISGDVPMLSTSAVRLRLAQAQQERSEANRAYVRQEIAKRYPVIAVMLAEIETEVTAGLIRDGLIRP